MEKNKTKRKFQMDKSNYKYVCVNSEVSFYFANLYWLLSPFIACISSH